MDSILITTTTIHNKEKKHYIKIFNHNKENKIPTVSRESAPSEENLDSPVTAESSGSASCFLTMEQTLSTVSGLACVDEIEKHITLSIYVNV